MYPLLSDTTAPRRTVHKTSLAERIVGNLKIHVQSTKTSITNYKIEKRSILDSQNNSTLVPNSQVHHTMFCHQPPNNQTINQNSKQLKKRKLHLKTQYNISSQDNAFLLPRFMNRSRTRRRALASHAESWMFKFQARQILRRSSKKVTAPLLKARQQV